MVCSAITNERSAVEEAAMTATESMPPGVVAQVGGQRIDAGGEHQDEGQRAAHHDQGEDRRHDLG